MNRKEVIQVSKNIEKFIKSNMNDISDKAATLINNFNKTVIKEEKKMDNTNIKLAAPWEIYRKELASLFENDASIAVSDVHREGNNYIIAISAYDHRKFLALSALMPEMVTFGNVLVRICMYDMENTEKDEIDKAEMLKVLFGGNDIFDGILGVTDHTGTKNYFAMFKPSVVQFYADDISDPYGNKTELPADIAKKIFGPKIGNAVKFSTSPIHER